MCFAISVSVPKEQALPIQRRLRSVGPLQIDAHRGGLFSKRFHFDISEDGTCACSLMHENAGTEAGHFRLRDDMREPLAATVTSLAKLVSKEFELSVLWIGDKAEVKELRLPELLDLIRKNQLQNRTAYAVTERNNP